MRIENEMLSRFKEAGKTEMSTTESSLAQELDFFFDNVLDSVVSYFEEEVTV